MESDNFENLLEQIEDKISTPEDQVKQLTELAERILRSGKRMAAPFSRKNKKTPEQSGRKSGDDDQTKAVRYASSPE